MARLLIIVTNKKDYPAFWEIAQTFQPVRSNTTDIKHVKVGDDQAFLLAEYVSGRSKQEDREAEARRETTHWVLQMSRLMIERAGAGAITELYVASHAGRVSWRTVEADAQVGGLLRGWIGFVHFALKPINHALEGFLAAPSAATYQSVIQIISSKYADADAGGKIFLDPSDAFSRVKHRMVRSLWIADLCLQRLERSDFDEADMANVIEKYKDKAGGLLNRFRASVYAEPDSLCAALEAIKEKAAEPGRAEIGRAWREVEKYLPRAGDVIYEADGERRANIGDILAGLGTAAGLERIRVGGGAKDFNEWYRRLDDALEDVRQAVFAEERRGAAAAAPAAAAGQ